MPPPDGPTRATVAPAGTESDTLRSAGSLEPGYEKLTLESSMLASFGWKALADSTSAMGATSMIVLIRRSASSAIMTASDEYMTFDIIVVVIAEKNA